MNATTHIPQLVIHPAFEAGKNAVAIVMSCDAKFIPYLDTTICSILAHANSSRCYDIIVLNGGIPCESIERTLVKNSDNVSIRFVNISDYFVGKTINVTERLPIAICYRLIIPKIMPEYAKAVYLDCDLVVNRDISDLFDTDIGNNLLAAVCDPDMIGQMSISGSPMEYYAQNTLLLHDTTKYFNSGVIIVNIPELSKAYPDEKLIEYAQSKHWDWVDQDVLNHTCQGRVKYLPANWNVMIDWKNRFTDDSRMNISICHAPPDLISEYVEARKDPWIVHYAGHQKPWRTPDCDMSAHFWKYARMSDYYPEIAGCAVFERIDEMLKMAEVIGGKNAEIASLARGIEERDTSIATLLREIESRKGEIANLARALEERDTRIHASVNEIESQKGVIANLTVDFQSATANLKAKDERISHLEENLMSLQKSHSFRIGRMLTWPLRVCLAPSLSKPSGK